MDWKLSTRLQALPPYIFARIDHLKEESRRKGRRLVDLGVGDPDLPTPAYIVSALKDAAMDSRNHRYPAYAGMKPFRLACAQHCKQKYNLELDADTEVLALIGSKEGL